jgi:hypothetical protein
LEFWFLLHFVDTDRFYENYNILLPVLQRYLPDYEKTERFFVKTNPDIYKKLRNNLKTAVINANKHKNFDFEDTQKGISEMYKFFNEPEIKRIFELK